MEILESLATAQRGDHDFIVQATARIGRLIELVEIILAVELVWRASTKAAVEVVEVGNLIVPKGHVGDDASNDWIAWVIPIYEQLTGKKAGTSIRAIGRAREGMAGGPLLRFLAAAGYPLRIRFPPHAWRQRVRAVLRDRR